MIIKFSFSFCFTLGLLLLHAQNWTHVGPLSTNLQPVNGAPNLFETAQLNLLEINPRNSQHLFCGGRYAGLWESKNGGDSWTRIPTEHLGSTGVGVIHFLNQDEILVANLHHIIGGIKKTYSEGIAVYNFSKQSFRELARLPEKDIIIFDALSFSHGNQTELILATSKGIFLHDFRKNSWSQITKESSQSLKLLSDARNIKASVVFSSTDSISGYPKVNLLEIRHLMSANTQELLATPLPVYTNDLLRTNNSTILSSKNLDCLVEIGAIRSIDDFDLYLLSDQEVRFDRKSSENLRTVDSHHLMLYKASFSNGKFQEPIIMHHDTHLSNLTGARTGLVYDAENQGVWFSGVRLHFAYDPTVSTRKFHNIRSGFKTGNGIIHDDIHELRIYNDKGKRYLIAACDGGIARSELPTFGPEEARVGQQVFFENVNNGLHVMLVNGFSGASNDPNFYVAGGFDITNTDFFRADLGRNEHTESTWENAGAIIDAFDNSLAIIDVSLYNQFYRVVRIDSLRNYNVSKNQTFHAPINPGQAPIRADLNQLSNSHNEVIGFQPRNFVQDPYRPGRIFYVKHKVGLHQFDFENGLFVRKLDLAEMNPEPEWAGWSHDWRWWRSVSFSPQTPNSMHIIINGSNDPKNNIQNPMIIRYVGSDLDACFGLDHTRQGKGGAQWQLISERFFNRFNRFMGTQLTREQIIDINLIDIATSPTRKSRIYILMRSKDDSRPKIVQFTGSKWVNYGAGLPDDEYAMAMVMDYKTNDGIYIATDKNIYYREAGMDAWICVTGNAPKLNIEQLEINYVDNTLRAGTFGLGIWKMPLYKK